MAALKYNMDKFFWIGVYFRDSDKLLLGPFQGPPACSPIIIPNGVCGQAVKREETIIVPNVNKFEGHIACSLESKSEIVIPLKKQDEITGVLDVDSDVINNFDETDKKYLEEISKVISGLILSSDIETW